MEHLRSTTLGQAILHYLHARHPSLSEYESLVLAEMVELAGTDLGRCLLLEDPTEFAEVTVRRAVIVLAEIRVSLRRAVRGQIEATEDPREEDDDQAGTSPDKA